jgi:hypothetical protein
MKPALILIALSILCAAALVSGCKKSTHTVTPLTINIDSILQPLAGSRVFFMACDTASSGAGCATYTAVTDSIGILNDSNIYLRNEKLQLTLSSYSSGILVFTNSSSGWYGQLAYRPGSDTVFFGYYNPAFSAGSTGCGGFSLINLKNSSPYTFSYPANASLYTPITFSSAAPAGSTFKWFFGDGTSSSQASPTHTFRSCDGMVALVVNNNLPIVKYLSLSLNLQSLTAARLWRVTEEVSTGSADTTYTLNDTTFGFTYVNNDTLSVLGNYFSMSAYRAYYRHNNTPDNWGLCDSTHQNTLLYYEPTQTFSIVLNSHNSTQTIRLTYKSP